MLQTTRPGRPREVYIEPRPIALRDVINGIFYYRRLALLIVVLIALLGTAVAFLLPPSFTARARLLTLSGGVYEMQLNTADAGKPIDPSMATDVEMQLLESPELHRQIVIQQLGPGASPESIEAALNTFESHLHLSKTELGNVIELQFRDRSAEHAAASLQMLLNTYLKQRAQILTSGRVEFLSQQRDKINQQLDQANAQIQAYEKQKGVVDVDAQINSAVSLDGLLHQKYSEAQAAVADSRKTVSVLQANAAKVPKEVELFSDSTEAAHTIGTMEASLFQLQEKRADLASRYMATSPFVTQIDAQIASLKSAIEQQKKNSTFAKRMGYNTYHDTVNDHLAQAEANLEGASARSSVLQEQVRASQDRLKDLIAISETIAGLTMQRDMLANTLKAYSNQLEQARVQENQTSSVGSTNVRLLESPTAPRRRNNPPLLMVTASIVAGIVIAAVTVMIVSTLRETFLAPDEAERALRLPVLCDLPRRDAPVRRDFGRMVAAIDSIPSGDQGKIILLLTAHVESRLLLVAQGLAAALETRAPGSVALVKMQAEAEVVEEPDGEARLPAAGNSVMSIGMAMTRARLAKQFDELRTQYDYIVMMAPPAFIAFESLELTTLANLSALVLQAETTRKPVAEAVISQAMYIGGEVHGLIMTGRRYHIPAWMYNRLLHGRSSII